MYAYYDLTQAEETLKELRKNNKLRIKQIELEIKTGYDKHGIIFTSQAHSLGNSIQRLKEDVTALAKKRNTIKKYLKQNNI